MPNKARKNDMYHFAAPFYKAKAENAIPKVNVKIIYIFNLISIGFISSSYHRGKIVLTRYMTTFTNYHQNQNKSSMIKNIWSLTAEKILKLK